MTHVVTDNCGGCRFTECVAVCPVACFHADGERLYIDPAVCIDCGGCVPACPVRAIVDAVDLAPAQQHWLDINRQQSREQPLISARQSPLPGAEQRRGALGF